MTPTQCIYVLNLGAKKLKPLIKEHEDSRSRTQSPQALWPAVGRQERLWGAGILIKFLDWLLRNGLHCFTAEIVR